MISSNLILWWKSLVLLIPNNVGVFYLKQVKKLWNKKKNIRIYCTKDVCLRVLRDILKKVVNAFLRCRITFCLKMTSSKVIDFQYIITRKLSYKFEIYHKFYCILCKAITLNIRIFFFNYFIFYDSYTEHRVDICWSNICLFKLNQLYWLILNQYNYYLLQSNFSILQFFFSFIS